MHEPNQQKITDHLQLPPLVGSGAFAPETLRVWDRSGDALKYQIANAEMGPAIETAHSRLAELREIVAREYEARFKVPFDQFKLGENFDWTVQRFKDNPIFREATSALKITQAEAEKVYLPWWNEITLAEADFDPATISTTTLLHHSYETQIVRRGAIRPGLNLQVCGVVCTAPDEQFETGALIVGLRGGNNYPNTYHLPAGSLGYSDELKRGESIYQAYLKTELLPELGLTEQDVTSNRLLCRFLDQLVDKGVGYTFAVTSNRTAAQVLERWSANPHEDKKEHTDLHFIPATRKGIMDFFSTFYSGAVQNDRGRPYEQRRLLHCGALPLAAWGGISTGELAEVAGRKGE